MPIVDIELVAPSTQATVPGRARALADAIGRALGAPTGRVWLRLRLLDATDYAENEVDDEGDAHR